MLAPDPPCQVSPTQWPCCFLRPVRHVKGALNPCWTGCVKGAMNSYIEWKYIRKILRESILLATVRCKLFLCFLKPDKVSRKNIIIVSSLSWSQFLDMHPMYHKQIKRLQTEKVGKHSPVQVCPCVCPFKSFYLCKSINLWASVVKLFGTCLPHS